jgi:hypothetical protein
MRCILRFDFIYMKKKSVLNPSLSKNPSLPALRNGRLQAVKSGLSGGNNSFTILTCLMLFITNPTNIPKQKMAKVLKFPGWLAHCGFIAGLLVSTRQLGYVKFPGFQASVTSRWARAAAAWPRCDGLQTSAERPD